MHLTHNESHGPPHYCQNTGRPPSKEKDPRLHLIFLSDYLFVAGYRLTRSGGQAGVGRKAGRPSQYHLNECTPDPAIICRQVGLMRAIGAQGAGRNTGTQKQQQLQQHKLETRHSPNVSKAPHGNVAHEREDVHERVEPRRDVVMQDMSW